MINPQDLKILLDLWKWKLLPTKALWIRHGAQATIGNHYARLRRLERQKLIQSSTISYSKTLWTLHKKGFTLIQSELPQLANSGFKSEHPIHDHLVTAFHLGEWVKEAPAGVELISEQMLRCYADDLFPKYLPKSIKHRPDGYWILNSKVNALSQIVALEVERNPKSHLTYQRYFDFYDEEKSISQVLWLITSASADRRIKNILASDRVMRKEIHFLIQYSDYENLGWNAPATNVFQIKTTTLDIVIQNRLKTHSKLVKNQNFKTLLDLRKIPLHSSTSELSKNSGIPN